MLEKSVLNKLKKARADASDILAKNYSEYCSQNFSSAEHRKFVLLKVQGSIVNFEICSDMLNVIKTEPSTLSRKVALKNLIHKIFEYNKTLKSVHIKTIRELAESKKLKHKKNQLTEISKKYRSIIKSIDQYKDLRNYATGHYDPDILKQIQAIESINEDEAHELIMTFLLFTKDIVLVMRDIGKS